MVYDKQDRMVLTQDPNLHNESKWLVTRYNDHDWPVATGIFTDANVPSRDRETIENDYNTNPAAFENILEHTRSWYSEYPANLAQEYQFTPLDGFSATFNTKIKGLVTYTETRVLGTDEWLGTVNYYDLDYRVIQTKGKNNVGGFDLIASRYDFTGKVMQSKQVHTSNLNETPKTVTIDKIFTYDKGGRMLSETMMVDNITQLTKYNYNELGQLVDKKLNCTGETSYLIKQSQQFNVRGWLTTLEYTDKDSNPLFGLDLMYNKNNVVETNKLYNGNISAMTWNTNRNADKSYNFTYDELERLKNADFSGLEGENYSTSYHYDANGNILDLTRYGVYGQNNDFGRIDWLDYAYKGNQLIKVHDQEPDIIARDAGFSETGPQNQVDPGDPLTHEYLYDDNGNMVADHNKGIVEVSYNHLNLPETIKLTDSRWIFYTYDAVGNKLQQRLYLEGTPGKETDYCGSFVYEDGNLIYILTSEGRLVPNAAGTGFVQEYFIKDHLGNTRMVLADKDNNQVLEFIQETHYYPFGLILEGQAFNTETNKYLYNGKELQDDFELSWYAYGARYYDAALGRFMSVDPLAEKNPTFNPYHYCSNNPINRIDPYGMEDGWVSGPYDQVLWDEEVNTQDEFNRKYAAANYSKPGSYEYLGQSFWGIDSDGNMGYGDNEGKYSFLLGEAVVTPDHSWGFNIIEYIDPSKKVKAVLGRIESGSVEVTINKSTIIHEGNFPITNVFDTRSTKRIGTEMGTQFGKLSFGGTGDFKYGNYLISLGTTSDGRIIIENSLPTFTKSSVGMQIVWNPKTTINGGLWLLESINKGMNRFVRGPGIFPWGLSPIYYAYLLI